MLENIGKDNIITLSSYPSAILHIDCDAFFASCEQARDPSLKGKPIVTGKERGIIASASYEAKAFGVKRGVRLKEAKNICPNLIMLPSDYETYSIYSKRLFEIIRRFTPTVEEFSIDEAFADITGLRRIYRTSYSGITRLIKETIHKELDITVSAGLSISKTIAKICSRFKKPDGLTAIPGYKLHKFLKNIPLDMVCGFGPNTVMLLEKHQIYNVLDYVNKPMAFAEKLLGKIGLELWRELRGESVYKVSIDKKNKYISISKTKTFSPPSAKKDFVKAQLLKNMESACIKLRRYSLSAKRITIYLKKEDFSPRGLEGELSRHSSSPLDFSEAAAVMFEKIFEGRTNYRAAGVVLSGIVTEGVDSITLFDDPVKIKGLGAISRAIDDMNDKYGKHTIHLAASDPAFGGIYSHSRNALPSRKIELLKGETFRRRLAIPLFKNSLA